MKTFSDQLKTLRKLAGLTQQEVADDVGKSIRTIRNWEACRNTPDIAVQEYVLKKIRGKSTFENTFLGWTKDDE